MRESQNLIVSSQNVGLTTQTNTNKLLADVVTNLETTHGLLDRFRDNSSSRVTTRLSDICDELGSAVTGLLSAQDQLGSCSTNNMAQLDKLIKSACNIMREDTWNTKKRLSLSTDGGPAAKRRTGGGGVRMLVKARSEDVPEDTNSEASENDWESAEVKQPTVRLHPAILSPKMKEEARKSLKSRDDNTTDDNSDSVELKDEFASPEKQ